MLPNTARPWKFVFALVALTGIAAATQAQEESVGPQTSAPPPVAPSHRRAPAGNGQKISVPAGTRLAVVLENGISTRSARAGDSLYFHTSFLLTTVRVYAARGFAGNGVLSGGCFGPRTRSADFQKVEGNW